MPYLELHDSNIAYKLKRSRKAKTITLKVNIRGDIELVAPSCTSIKIIEMFIRTNQNWIIKQLEHFKKISKAIPQHQYKTGELFSYLGKPYELVVNEVKIKQIHLEQQGNNFLITLPLDLSTNDKSKNIKNLLEKWYRNRAREVIIKRLDYYNKYYKLSYNKIFIKNQKTRWGSCSTLKNLNFNWRIIMAPLPIVDYIVVHELCHIKEQNHSTAFWSLVEQQIPDYKKRKAWLKNNGMTLVI
ncbi:M48 family metallopeptidase [Desulfolucanica intricata]|uniref:M48 family metallopeptidase n=1 Tax=Desulfolucanica intricata TaxID=1285191 RepID=UPI00082D1857|nr:SprT family zinc-dependent metalloprotease [Desulfolucanica intricata]